MRITQSTIMRNYISNLRNSITNLSKSNERLASLSKYTRASDNTSAVSRAFTIREQLYKNEQYLSNMEDAESELSASEDYLRLVKSILQTVNERAMRGVNGTLEESDREVIAREIDDMKDQVLQMMNARFGTRFLFANSNNKYAPFAVDHNGDGTYNGILLRNISEDPSTGELRYLNPLYDPTAPDPVDEYLPVPKNKDVYIDMGLGLVVTGNEVDPKTAIKLSVSGIDVVGYGEENLFDLLSAISDGFRTNDLSRMDDWLNKLEKATDKVMLHVTDIGNRTSFISQTKERINTEIFNLKVKQDNIEAVDIEYEAIHNKSFEMAWMINLQLGSQIIPPSIFDFMR
jgi:flagellar hook-associated protein 3 FlgL